VTSAVAAPPLPAAVRAAPRRDVQALRAVAVGAVLLNHLWPGRLPGGYVGVDVFFVISGFLITGHLLRELASCGRIQFAQFYARRVRRLLPAALLVLAAAALAAWLFLPFSRWARNAQEITASGFYVENWFLALRSVDYSALNDDASLSQHYWSLSVEEQFYLLWPLLLFVLARLGRRRGNARGWLAAGVLGVGVLSLALSVFWTRHWPAPAYFATPVRFWEFALGAGLALLASRPAARWASLPAAWRLAAQLAALAGFGLIAWSAFAYGQATAFPGWRALVPAVGAALVIAAGTALDDRLWHTPVTSWRPVQWLGDISYSLYLWHWPLIVIAPFAVHHSLTFIDRLVVAVASVGLAGLTKRFVEDPGRAWRWASARPRRTFAAMAAGMALVGLAGAGLGGAAVLAAPPPLLPVPPVSPGADWPPTAPCLGPAALAPGAGCPDPFGPAADPVMTQNNEYWAVPPDCVKPAADDDVRAFACDFSGQAPPARRVWLVGDSHAQQWQAGVIAVARQRGWVLTASYFGACPAAEVDWLSYRGDPAVPERIAECVAWREAARQAVLDDHADMVLTSFFARAEEVGGAAGQSQNDIYIPGLRAYWDSWLDAGVQVYVLGDPPFNGSVRDRDCVVLSPRDPVSCAVERSVAQPEDPLLAAAAAAAGDGVVGIDLTDRFCDSQRCYAVVGGVPVYYDADHLNREYAELLAPLLSERLP
jgi:peptidoglycan/LPS O-acetylase OafA/YrhL